MIRLPSVHPSWIPRGCSVLPLKWTGCPCVTLLAAANRARIFIFSSLWPLVQLCRARQAGNASASGLRSLIWPRLVAVILPMQPCPALPYAPGPNASGFAAAAFSAPLASSMLAVPLARPGMAPTTSTAPLAHAHRLLRIQLRPRRCLRNHGHASKPKRAWASLRARSYGTDSCGGRRRHNENVSESRRRRRFGAIIHSPDFHHSTVSAHRLES
jgi:hypothetical protein